MNWFGWNSKWMELVWFLKYINSEMIWCGFGLVSKPTISRVRAHQIQFPWKRQARRSARLLEPLSKRMVDGCAMALGEARESEQEGPCPVATPRPRSPPRRPLCGPDLAWDPHEHKSVASAYYVTWSATYVHTLK